MKIESSTKPAGLAIVNETRSHSANKADKASSADVQLSSLSAQMGISGEDQPFDTARVAEIKQAISEGRFTINAGAIADRLINATKEFVTAHGKV